MNWNWLGWLLWLGALAYLCWVIHYIRVHQLMLIAKTGNRVDSKLMTRYVLFLVLAFCWVGGMYYLTFGRNVDYTDTAAVTVKTKYETLQLSSSGTNYYYVLANRSQGGNHVVSYTYSTTSQKETVSARFAQVTTSDNLVEGTAKQYPWNLKKLQSLDTNSSHAFVAEMNVTYKNTILNGMGLRSGRPAGQFTLIRVPAENLVEKD